MANYDLIVIGAGPAGYVAAIKAAQLGKKVACVDKERTGGTCNNYGCIPTKALLKNAELYHTMKHRARGVWLQDRRAQLRLGRDLQALAHGLREGHGGRRFPLQEKQDRLDPRRSLDGQDGRGEGEAGRWQDRDAHGEERPHRHGLRVASAARVSISRATTVIGSKEALSLPAQPKSMVIIGAGAIGVEFAYFFNAFGTKVTIVEMLPNLLPVEDTEVSQALEKSFTKQGITFLTNHKTTKTEVSDKGVKITVADAKNAEKVIEAETVLVAIGVAPVLPGGSLKFELVKGFLKTDDRYQTSVPGVFAAGDIIGPPWLAHVASYEAVQAVEGMFDREVQAEESHASSPAAPIASRRSPASASPSARRRKRGSSTRSANSPTWRSARRARSARAKAS